MLRLTQLITELRRARCPNCSGKYLWPHNLARYDYAPWHKASFCTGMHWTPTAHHHGTVNSVNVPTDPFSGQPALKSNAVTAQVWRNGTGSGLHHRTVPATAYANGWQVELAENPKPIGKLRRDT
jgi:hypothetical protein